MPTEREKTLDEWCGQLHPKHPVNKQQAELKADSYRPSGTYYIVSSIALIALITGIAVGALRSI